MTILGGDVDSRFSAVMWDDKMNLRTDADMMQKLVDKELFRIWWIDAFYIVSCWSVLMRLDVITNRLSSIVDIASESGLDAAFLWSKGDVEESFVKASLSVLKEKVSFDSILNDLSVSVQILCYFGGKRIVELLVFDG